MNYQTKPLFFIGSSPSQAATIINPQAPCAGVMVSVAALRKRVSDFRVGDWILDSGAFSEVTRHGGYRDRVEEYHYQIQRWSSCGNLLTAVSQDWMCEPFALLRTGLTVQLHQELTIERYDALIRLKPPVSIMPVLQGYQSSDYVAHLQQYGDRLRPGAWVGVGSVCRRNGNPTEIANLLRGIKLLRPDLRLHGFGLKILALENAEVRSLLYSCDSMAWSYPLRFRRSPMDCVQNQHPAVTAGSDLVRNLAHKYQERVAKAGTKPKRVPVRAGAGNGQGRKPKWKSHTTAIRIPEKYAPKLIALARKWEELE